MRSLLPLLVVLLTAVPARGQAPTEAPAVPVEAVPTRVVVRAVAHGAKVLGDGVGGARITIRHAKTGAVLARGLQRGSTGDTDRIMRTGHARGDTLYATPGTAAFDTTLALARPTPVTVTAEGPLGVPQATRQASTSLVLFPGQAVAGDGLVLTLYGLLVEVEEPAPEGATLPVRATVEMLCGCPTEPGGLWDADGFTITARLVADGRTLAETPLRYAGTRSHYEGALPLPAAPPAGAEVVVLAADSEGANTGIARRSLTTASDS